MEYRIYSGQTVEIQRSYMSVRSCGESKPKRAPRVAGNSSVKKIIANNLSSEREAARVINCNYVAGDGHVVLKYYPDRRPESYEAAENNLGKFLRKYRTKFKAKYGRNPKVFWVTANWSPKRNAPAALHHHLVIEADGIELAMKLWDGGAVSVEQLDNRGDHSELAAYLVQNVHDRPAKKKWHCSRDMDRPIYTEPVPIDDVEDICPEKGSVIKEFRTTANEDGDCVIAAYMRCRLDTVPYVRGGKVVRPGRKGAARNGKRE